MMSFSKKKGPKLIQASPEISSIHRHLKILGLPENSDVEDENHSDKQNQKHICFKGFKNLVKK